MPVPSAHLHESAEDVLPTSFETQLTLRGGSSSTRYGAAVMPYASPGDGAVAKAGETSAVLLPPSYLVIVAICGDVHPVTNVIPV